MGTPRLSLAGGINAIEQAFSWELTAGTEYTRKNILFPREYLDSILAISGPTSLSLAYDERVGGSGDFENKTLNIGGVWVLPARIIDKVLISVPIADSRYAWRGRKLVCSYNKTRSANAPGALTDPNLNSPAALRAPFDQFTQGRYCPWSVKSDGTPYPLNEIIK
jgi:hypothetical protein